VEKWQIAAGGGVVGLILIIVIGVAMSGGKGASPGDGGGGDTGGGDSDNVVVDPVGPPAEKVIWTYHDGDLSPYQQLCKETIEKHKGDFDFKFLNKDDVTQHISMEDLPKDWDALNPQYKRDAAINALLARHGGVALDINTIMFRSLDPWWDDIIEEKGVAFKGFYYKSRAETATWFMMVGDKGTGMMQTAVEQQKKLSGNEPASCMEKDREDHRCYGSSVISFALCTYQSEYCTCYKGATEGGEFLKVKSKDSDAQYDLADPRKTVQSDIEPNILPKVDEWQPMKMITEGESEEDFTNFKVRFNGEESPFITLQAPTSKTDGIASKSRDELLKGDDAESTFFYQWLCRAKHQGTREDACGQ